MAWEENSCISLNMQLIAILSRIGVLKDHGSLTKSEIVHLLWDVLPDQLDDKQKNNKLDYLLKRLRKAGKIWTERNEVTSVWHLTEK